MCKTDCIIFSHVINISLQCLPQVCDSTVFYKFGSDLFMRYSILICLCVIKNSMQGYAVPVDKLKAISKLIEP